jgi:hypothetical protein
MTWKGDWKGDAFHGEHTFPDGTVFKGVAEHRDKHVLVHTNADGFTKTVEHPVEPHWQFTGTWVAKDGGAGSPMTPPAPPAKQAAAPSPAPAEKGV